MALKLFNPFARYVVVEVGNFYYSDPLGQTASVNPVRPAHYTDDLRDAEDVAHGLTEARESQYMSYEVCENAAWKTLDKRAGILKATAEGDGLSIERQLGIAAETLYEMLVLTEEHEEKYCERCEQKTGSLSKTLCPDCEAYADALGRKCACCGGTSCVPGTNLCGLCKAAETMARQDSERRQQEEFRQRRRNMGTALERTDAPDTPTAKPEGSAVWAKIDK